MKGLFGELKRRNVFKVCITYLALAWILIQVTEIAVPALNLPTSINSIVFYLSLVGFPFALFFSWIFELTLDNGKDSNVVNDEIDSDNVPINIKVSPTIKFNKPSIAVLPFSNLSDNKEEEYFADGMTEDIITELARFPSLAVIARKSSFIYKEQSVDAQQVSQDLGVQYVVTGSVRRSKSKIRIAVQLIDSNTNENVWAERYDRALEDFFDLQDEITRTIVSVLPGRIEANREEQTSRTMTADMAAYDCLVRGKIHHHNVTQTDNAEAIKYLDKAIKLEPDYAQAHAWRACVLGQAWSKGYPTGTDDPMKEAGISLEKAYALDKTDPECHRLLSAVSLIRKDYEKAKEHQEQGLALSPNYDLIVVQQGELLTWTGHGEEGAKWVEKAMHLNPYHPPRFWSHLGRARFVAGQHQQALDAFKKNTLPDVATYALMAASNAYLNDSECAKNFTEKVLEIQPQFSVAEHVNNLPYQHDSDAEHHREGLIKAGLPL